MASRQRSFFDTNVKDRPRWHGGRKFDNAPRAVEQNAKSLVVMPPIPASSTSKSKLQAFQFQSRSKKSEVSKPVHAVPTLEELAEKENIIPDQPTMAVSQVLPCPPPLSQRSQHKECPQTPIGRLPLAELIASVDENANQNLNLTPVERVLWHHTPGSSQFISSQDGSALRKGRKRARSSSPPTSSPNEASNRIPEKKQSFDLQTLQKTLTTPQADPAGDLWTRYSLKTGGIHDGSPTKNETFAELLKSSSPQTPSSHLKTRNLGGLRRAASCANEWPTTAAKRRRLNPSSSQNYALDDRPTEGDNENTRLSRVNLLVEQIQNGLLKTRTANVKIRDPVDSSPSPDKATAPEQSQSSPAREMHAHGDQLDDLMNPDFFSSGTAEPQLPQDEHIVVAEGVSDFEDDDFDDDILKAVDVKLAPNERTNTSASSDMHHPIPDQVSTNPEPVLSKATARQGFPPLSERERSCSFKKLAAGRDTKSQAQLISHDDFNNDYDDDDDDENSMTAADLEDLVALCDQQSQKLQTRSHHSQFGQKSPRKQSPRKSLTEPLIFKKPLNKTDARANQAFHAVVDVSSDEEFGEGVDFEDIVAECTAAGQPSSQHLSRRQRCTIQRYQVVKVLEAESVTYDGYKRPEKVLETIILVPLFDADGRKVLLVQPERSKTNKAIILRQSWVRSPCSPNSYVHLIGEFDNLGQCIIDDTQNMLILHPDHLVSATVVGDSFSCIRRAVLQDRVKVTNESNESQVYGHILHEIFQEAMKANRWDDEWLHTTIERVTSRYLESFFEINIDPIRAIDQLKSKAIPLQAWADTFVSARPKAEAVVKDRNGNTSTFGVNKLLEVEEKVWSPMYGLKGNVDATVQIMTSDESEDKILTVPFELKTGKHSNAAHKAQTVLYTLLLSDRYDINVVCGILYYMESSEISRLPAIRHELMHMVMQRNELASYVRQRVELPPMLQSPHLCGRCYAQTACFVYHRLAEGGDGETSGMKEKFDEVIRHLNPSHSAFFKKWDDLLTKEEKDIVKIRRELWTMQSGEREKVGRCFSNVVIEPGSATEMEDAPKINRYHYAFVKQKHVSGFSFLESQITTGEPIVISDERGHFALANGYVTAIRKRRIEVAVDRRLSNARARRQDFNSQDYQNFVGIMEVLDQGGANITLSPEQPQEPMSYRIDKDEFSNGMATVRNNLISLMDKDVFGSQALRKLIVQNAAPTFRPGPSNYSLGDSVSQESLNVDQRNAIEKVLSAKDYALVLGMPGTGKTTTIAHIIRALTAQGKSVLLTSYTHTAVDNILLKIRHDNIGVFRLGALAKVHPDVQDFADLAGMPMKSIEEIKMAYGRPIVATTCLGINHPVFNQKIFDYCIVDEASQITLPVCLGPIRMARTFILVGDHNQLPPLVQNKEAQEGGLDVSLFKILSDNQPSSVVNLEHQYRMCEDVMSLSKTLIYNGRLKCGNDRVAQRSIRIPRMEALKQHHHTPSSLMSANLNPKAVCLNPTRALCWIRDLLDPSTKACLVNTDTLLPFSRESETGSRIVNTCEASLCTQLVQSLLTVGVPAADVGVITLYRSQLALIKQNLRQYHPAVEMHTADKFQGRDKEVVILSLVRSNESLNVGELLRDWRRVNVALTRARTKFLILGSKSTMMGNELLERFVKFMDGRNWVYDLPKGALEGHVFDDGATPLTAKIGSHDEVKEVQKKDIPKPKRIDAFFEKSKGKESKAPTKSGKVTEKALLGSRPVLRDIVNDAS
ncbi:MAG: hypothetical protein Q9181_007011 [Wetmoreana brouardii]